LANTEPTGSPAGTVRASSWSRRRLNSTAETQLRQELQQAQIQLRRFLPIGGEPTGQAQLRQQLEEPRGNCRWRRRSSLPNRPGLEARTKSCRRPSRGGAEGQAPDRKVGHRKPASAGCGSRRRARLAEPGANWKRNWRSTSRSRPVCVSSWRRPRSNWRRSRKLPRREARLEAQAKESRRPRREVEQKLKSLTEALAFETNAAKRLNDWRFDAFKLSSRKAGSQTGQEPGGGEGLAATDGRSDWCQSRGASWKLSWPKTSGRRRSYARVGGSHKQLQAPKERYLAEQSKLAAGTETLRADLSVKRPGCQTRLGREGRWEAVREFC